jgi:outer membrane protein TolC
MTPLRFPTLCALFLLPVVLLPAQDSDARLTLDDAVRLALANNRSIKVDTYTRAIARANLLAAYGQFDPALNFSRSYSESYTPTLTSSSAGYVPPSSLVQTDNYSLALEGIMPWGLQYSLGGTSQNQRGTFNGFANNFQTFGGIQVRQPLLRGLGFGTNLLNVRIAKADRAISDWQYRQTVIETVTNVVIAYSNLSLMHEYLAVAQRYRDGAARLLGENEKRFKVGSISENDVVSARARTALREEGVLTAERGLRDSDNQLRALLGEASFTNDGPLLAIAPLPAPELEVQPARDLQKAYTLRPDFQQTRFAVDKSRYSDASARNQLLPQVNFVGNYGYAGLGNSLGASRQMVADRDNRYYSAGVEVSVPLTFAQGRGKARAARLQRFQAEAVLKRMEEDIALSIAAAAGQIETTRKRVVATHTAREINQQLLDAELKRLRAGTGSTFSVLYQQDLLSQADGEYSQALADQRRAVAVYDREIGTTLARYHITLTDQ